METSCTTSHNFYFYNCKISLLKNREIRKGIDHLKFIDSAINNLAVDENNSQERK